MKKPINSETGREKEQVGIRLPFFDYTGREVLSISKYETKINDEIRRVKDLTCGYSSGWIKSTRSIGEIFGEDSVKFIHGVGQSTLNKLEIGNIKKVKDLMFLQYSHTEIINELKVISEIPGTPSLSTLKRLQLKANSATPGSPPAEENYLIHPNPYLARYGETEWRNEIKKVTGMKKYCCIKELVLHIHEETRQAFKGTKYESTYLFYHGALTTMTDIECRDWMEEEGILKRWILPEFGCNDEIVIVDDDGNEKRNKNFKGRPVGDCMELMPLDNSLFRDFRTCFDVHVTLTSILPSTDSRRFSKGTPKSITASVSRIWDPVNGVSPPSNRIIQDITRMTENIMLVIEAGGAIVPGVCDRNGHRRKQREGVPDRRGKYDRSIINENEEAKALDTTNLHVDCKEVVLQFYSTETCKFDAYLASVGIQSEQLESDSD